MLKNMVVCFIEHYISDKLERGCMTEIQLYNLIKDHCPGHVERIENCVDSGTPDMSGALGNDYWIELKVARSATDTIDSLLRSSQKAWHCRRAILGTKIFVVIRYMKHILLYRRSNRAEQEYTLLLMMKPRYDWAKFNSTIKESIQC